MKKSILFLLFLCISVTLKAQIHEIGVFLGGSNYIGDIGRENYIYPNDKAFGVFYKYNLNPRISIKGAFTYADIKANDADSDNIVRKNRDYKFNNTIKELALGLEFNFFEYNQQSDYNYYTPYIIVEAVAFQHHVVVNETAPNRYTYDTKTGFTIPFGVGYKTRLLSNLAIAFEIKARYTFTDELDYNNPNIPALSFGNPKSNDWYMLTGISLIYAFGREACYGPYQN